MRRGASVLLSVLLLLALVFIWGNSMLSKEQSSALSGWVQGLFGSVAPGSAVSGEGGQHIIRKAAHVLEFAVLGLLLALRFPLERPWMRCACAVGIALCVAALDETIQIFSDRGSMVSDVIIDFFGALGGAIIGGILSNLRGVTRSSRQKSNL